MAKYEKCNDAGCCYNDWGICTRCEERGCEHNDRGGCASYSSKKGFPCDYEPVLMDINGVE